MAAHVAVGCGAFRVLGTGMRLRMRAKMLPRSAPARSVPPIWDTSGAGFFRRGALCVGGARPKKLHAGYNVR